MLNTQNMCHMMKYLPGQKILFNHKGPNNNCLFISLSVLLTLVIQTAEPLPFSCSLP